MLIVGGTQKERKEKAKSFFPKPTPHPDFLYLTPEISIGIDQIRRVKHFVGLRPYSEIYKVAYIEEAQNLTIEAQNAFLKTLEEPPERTIVILTAPSIDSLLPTIVSRCQILSLKRIILEEKNDDDKKFIEFILLISKSIADTFSYASSFFRERNSAKKWLEENERILFNLFHKSKRDGENVFSLTNLQYLLLQQAMREAKKRISQNVNPRFVLENFFIETGSILP